MRVRGQIAWLALLCACATPAESAPALQRISAPNLILEFDGTLQSRLIARFGGTETPLDDFRTTESVVIADKAVAGFPLKSAVHRPVKDEIGAGVRYLLRGETPSLRKELTVTIYADFPTMAFLQTRYTNIGTE